MNTDVLQSDFDHTEAAAPRLPVINNPENVTRGQHLLGGVLTLAFWTLWFYIWLPLISLAAWLFGITLFYERILEIGGYQYLLDILPFLVLSVLLPSGALIIWAQYNYRRFGKLERRRRRPDLTPAELAAHLGWNEADLLILQNVSALVVEHDEAGRIADAQMHVATPPSTRERGNSVSGHASTSMGTATRINSATDEDTVVL